jgi:uncharacterized membrane protein
VYTACMNTREEKTIYELFKLSIIFKAVGSIAEMLAGITIALIPGSAVLHAALFITHGDVDGDVNDILARGVIGAAHWLSISNGWFIGGYLLLRGLIQLVLVLELLRNKLWAYPALLVVMSLLVVTQIYDIYFSHSIPTISLTIFDLVTMYLIWHEYVLVKKAQAV